MNLWRDNCCLKNDYDSNTKLSRILLNLHYNVDSNTKSSNYMKIRLKDLIYFELQQTLN